MLRKIGRAFARILLYTVGWALVGCVVAGSVAATGEPEAEGAITLVGALSGALAGAAFATLLVSTGESTRMRLAIFALIAGVVGWLGPALAWFTDVELQEVVPVGKVLVLLIPIVSGALILSQIRRMGQAPPTIP
jgi:hypothetical protein